MQENDMLVVLEILKNYCAYMDNELRIKTTNYPKMHITNDQKESLQRVIERVNDLDIKNALFHALRFDIEVVEGKK